MTDHSTANLIRSLSKSQRNHLRVILSRPTGVTALREELGIQPKTKTSALTLDRDFGTDITVSL